MALKARTRRCSGSVCSLRYFCRFGEALGRRTIEPKDEIAAAIARCAGCFADDIATGESVDRGEGRAIPCDGGSHIFFHR